MLRGINQVRFFYDDFDRQTFLMRLMRYKDEGSYQMYAYALMGNHVHLLVKEGKDTISVSMKRLTVSYCHYFNKKYDRSGYLFTGRFKSEPVESDAYLLAMIRYIHNNPVKIGKAINSWTSYNDYLSFSDCIDSAFVLSLLADDEVQARKLFQSFVNAEEDGEDGERSMLEGSTILGAETVRRLSDEQAIEIVKEVANVDACSRLIELDGESRDKVLFQLKSKGLSIRQISRLTGIGRGIVQKAGEDGLSKVGDV